MAIDHLDVDLALRCLRLAGDLQRLHELDPGERSEVVAEVAGLLILLGEVFMESEGTLN